MKPAAPAFSISRRDIDAVRGDARFRVVVEGFVAADLARYRALTPIERWMISDVGRSSLSGAVFALDAVNRLTPTALMSVGAGATGEVSLGRARLYLRRAVANGLIETVEPGVRLTGNAQLAATPRFQKVMGDILHAALEATATLAPDVAPALREMGRPTFVQQLSFWAGSLTASHPDLFPLDSPYQLFQARDGGARIMAELISRQSPERERLLERCFYSNSALARAGLCSRAHVIQLLKDGAGRGFLTFDGSVLTIDPKLSEATETYFAHLFAVVRAAATRTLSKG